MLKSTAPYPGKGGNREAGPSIWSAAKALARIDIAHSTSRCGTGQVDIVICSSRGDICVNPSPRHRDTPSPFVDEVLNLRIIPSADRVPQGVDMTQRSLQVRILILTLEQTLAFARSEQLERQLGLANLGQGWRGRAFCNF